MDFKVIHKYNEGAELYKAIAEREEAAQHFVDMRSDSIWKLATDWPKNLWHQVLFCADMLSRELDKLKDENKLLKRELATARQDLEDYYARNKRQRRDEYDYYNPDKHTGFPVKEVYEDRYDADGVPYRIATTRPTKKNKYPYEHDEASYYGEPVGGPSTTDLSLDKFVEQETKQEKLFRELRAAHECPYEEPWVGYCRKPAIPQSDYCVEHAKDQCWKCGAQAVRGCSMASSLVCGVPECAKHPHQHGF